MGRVKHSNPDGNIIFHVALDEEGHLQPIIAATLHIDNRELIEDLLQAEEVACTEVSANSGERYALLYDGKGKKPLPSVMIWKYIKDGEDSVFVDMGEGDENVIVPYVVKHLLKAEEE